MMRTMEEEEEEEEHQRLIYRVVEYVDPLMGEELLSKFPDNSAYDFDYTQSSIWSPLVPHPYKHCKNNVKPISLSMSMEITPQSRKKQSSSSSCVFGLMNKSNLKRVTTNIKKNIASTAFNINLNLAKTKKKKKKTNNLNHEDFDISPNHPSFKPTSRLISTKGWGKVLKAASKQFKKKKKNDPTVHVRLSSSLRDGNFNGH